MSAERNGRPGRHISPVRVVRRPAAAVAVLCGLVAIGVGAAGLAVALQTGHPATPLGRTPFVPVPRVSQTPVPEVTAGTSIAAPVQLIIPKIGVSTPLVRLGITPQHTLQVPASTAVAGWYTGSPRPGAIGAAVIVGHVDSHLTDGVFFRLRELHRGDRVYVMRADHTTVVFRVYGVHRYLKTGFPTRAVYGATPNAQLRLITCGGTFDWATGHYLSNVIVYATLITRSRSIVALASRRSGRRGRLSGHIRRSLLAAALDWAGPARFADISLYGVQRVLRCARAARTRGAPPPAVGRCLRRTGPGTRFHYHYQRLPR
jgi:sortase (surface protein transpeptidase)